MRWNIWVKCWRTMKRSALYCTVPWTLWPYLGLMPSPAACQDDSCSFKCWLLLYRDRRDLKIQLLLLTTIQVYPALAEGCSDLISLFHTRVLICWISGKHQCGKNKIKLHFLLGRIWIMVNEICFCWMDTQWQKRLEVMSWDVLPYICSPPMHYIGIILHVISTFYFIHILVIHFLFTLRFG